ATRATRGRGAAQKRAAGADATDGSKVTASPMSAMARSAWPRATGQAAISRANGAPTKTTASVSQKPSTAIAQATTPKPAAITLTTPSATRNTDHVRSVL